DVFAAALGKLPERAPSAENPDRAVWQRVLSPLVEVRRTESRTVVAPTERAAGQAALQIELSLARAALERDDVAGFRAGIVRMEAWLTRLWPDSPALQQRRNELKALRAAPLQPSLPVLGSTLQQLRQLRNSGHTLPLPQATAPQSPSTAEIER
ncbi:MAG: uroporphyrinogen-III C-methyltransferase, partial [Pseudoxanthomonas sp.]